MLTRINLENNKLSSLPEEFSQLEHLQQICLSTNSFTEIPACICGILSLHEIIMEHNKVTEIPEELGNLKLLQTLKLFGNKIEDVSNGVLESLPHLITLDLTCNYLKSIPDALYDKRGVVVDENVKPESKFKKKKRKRVTTKSKSKTETKPKKQKTRAKKKTTKK